MIFNNFLLFIKNSSTGQEKNMTLNQNKSLSMTKKIFFSATLFFSFVPVAFSQTGLKNGEQEQVEIRTGSSPSEKLFLKDFQIGGVPAARSMMEYFKISKSMQSEIQKFCGNVAAKAGDTRSALQIGKMAQLKREIEEKIQKLEEKRQEYEEWLKKRDDFLNKTKDSFVEIISKMKPSNAAQQLALIDDYTVASIILKLNPRVSSLIMDELPPRKTAAITRVLTSAQHIPKKKKATDNLELKK